MSGTKFGVSQKDFDELSKHIEAAREICLRNKNEIINLSGTKIVNPLVTGVMNIDMCLTEVQAYMRNPKDETIETGNNEVLMFIEDFYRNVPQFYREGLRMEFRAGYCYYFAHILKHAFPGGTIVWCAPFSHIAYQYKSEVYDVEGIYSGEADFFIPIERIGHHVRDFMHIPGENYDGASKEEIGEMIDKYRKDKRGDFLALLKEYKGRGAESLHELDSVVLRRCYSCLIEVLTRYKDINEIIMELYISLMSDDFHFVPYHT